jgi:hypothetical protein
MGAWTVKLEAMLAGCAGSTGSSRRRRLAKPIFLFVVDRLYI